MTTRKRPIEIDGRHYAWTVGSDLLEVRDHDDRTIARPPLADVKGCAQFHIDKGRWKGNQDGAVTPFEVRQWILRNLHDAADQADRELEARRAERTAPEPQPAPEPAWLQGYEDHDVRRTVYPVFAECANEDGMPIRRLVGVVDDPAAAKRLVAEGNDKAFAAAGLDRRDLARHDGDAYRAILTATGGSGWRFRSEERVLNQMDPGIVDEVRNSLDSLLQEA